ncbi:MAG: transposase [Candidatus Doudnabacteria bacterium]|nr:transposase [Candidatus Doudnabacteria bacterium]
MARQPRLDIADQIYHVINRSNARWDIFKTDKDFQGVVNSLIETLELIPIDIFAFILMSNHWHFVIRPKQNDDMGRFFGKFTQKATQRWHTKHSTVGTGHLFQGRFKSFLVEKDSYFLQLVKYVEANALRAKMVKKAEDWPWSSLYLRLKHPELAKKVLAPWPIDIPRSYLSLVNQSLPKVQLDNIRTSIEKSRPLGSEAWVARQVGKYDLSYTLRQRGRPFGS